MASQWDVIIIGGGAAGLWAAGTAAERKCRTLVLEKNRKPGVKILMSGGTRCNLTHHCPGEGIVEAFGPPGKFLYPALANLSPADVVRTIEALGVPTKVEPSGKVFPVSDRAVDVRDALVRRALRAGASLRTGVHVRGIHFDPAHKLFRLEIDDEQPSAPRVIVACGGLSYPECGTTGDGYAWTQSFGHTIVSPRPALTPLVSPEPWVHALRGITLPDVHIRVEPSAAAKTRHRDPRLESRASLLWTHFGLSGPAALNVSRAWTPDLEAGRQSVRIDLFPDISLQQWQDWFSPRTGKGHLTVEQTLRNHLPKRLLDTLLCKSGVAPETRLAELRREKLARLTETVRSLPVRIDRTLGYGKAEVTAGGVDLDEVNPRTLESRLRPGLFLAGEILDLDGPIGGYNFQAAFSTGHTAALHV